MSVTITIRENASIKIEGEFVLLDHAGAPVEYNKDKPLALCRCGLSSRKPFCDSSHKRAGWKAVNLLIEPVAPVAPVAPIEPVAPVVPVAPTP